MCGTQSFRQHASAELGLICSPHAIHAYSRNTAIPKEIYRLGRTHRQQRQQQSPANYDATTVGAKGSAADDPRDTTVQDAQDICGECHASEYERKIPGGKTLYSYTALQSRNFPLSQKFP